MQDFRDHNEWEQTLTETGWEGVFLPTTTLGGMGQNANRPEGSGF